MVETGLYKFSEGSVSKFYKIQKLNLNSAYGDQFLISWGTTKDCTMGSQWMGRSKTIQKQNEKINKGYKLLEKVDELIDPSNELISKIRGYFKWVHISVEDMVPNRERASVESMTETAKETKPKNDVEIFWDELLKK